MCTFLCAVFAWIVWCIVTSRDSEIGRVCTHRPIDGWRFHNFLANATMRPYLYEITMSSVVLFVSGIFMNSAIKPVIYCSCSSLGMRLRNGLTDVKASKKKNKHISKRISSYTACLMTVPGHSNVARGVTQ